jgi:hypothetical protein
MPPQIEEIRPAEFVPPPGTATVSASTRTSAEVPALRADETEEKSIWEIFGLPRPSETGEMQAAAPADPTTPEAPIPYPRVEIAPPPRPYIGELPSAGRVGLRIRARRKLVRVRRPS